MILDGKKTAEKILEEIKEKISSFQGRKPGLAFILVGENPASQTYVQMKAKACKQVGICSHVIQLPQDVEEENLLKEIHSWNHDLKIDGILVQQPLPKHLDSMKVITNVLPEKDVDGFHPLNLGKLMLGHEDGFISCTPLGILTLLLRYNIPITGKHVVIVGRSNIVGKPLASLLMQKKAGRSATVTVAHSQTENLKEITRSADILISAMGRAKTITKEMVKKGAVVIDVGINRVLSSQQKPIIMGDVDFEEVLPIASAITPVPKGIGPMTIAMLMQNTLKSFLKIERRV